MRARYRDFAFQGAVAGLVWAVLYLALDHYLGGNPQSGPEIIGNLVGHVLIFLAIGLLLARGVNWVGERAAKARRDQGLVS